MVGEAVGSEVIGDVDGDVTGSVVVGDTGDDMVGSELLGAAMRSVVVGDTDVLSNAE